MTMLRFSLCLLVVLLANPVIVAALDDDDMEFVTCGSAVKMSHYESQASTKTKHFLSSEGKNLGSGSGQQIVTAVTDESTSNTLWWIRGATHGTDVRGDETACAQQGTGQNIPCGSIIRLTHLNSMKNLHSHNVRSPLSRQQEVSCFGDGDGKGDNGDDWRVVCNTQYWKREEMVSFEHVDSNKYLGASSTVKFTHQNCGHNCPILNHLEVFGRSQKDNFAMWVVEMGVHLSL